MHSFKIKGKYDLDDKCVIVFDCENINGHTAWFTVMNVEHGEQITLNMQVQTDTTLNPEDIHIVLDAEQVLEIKGSYVRVAE